MRHRCVPLIFTLLAVLLVSCSSPEQGGDAPQREQEGNAPMPAVEVIKARFGALPLQQRLSGTVQAENQVAIYPEISARIVRVAAQNGDYVQRGQPLVYLRDTAFREQLKQAEAALQMAEAEAKRTEATLRELQARLRRAEQLAEKQFQSAQELETVQAQADAAAATHEQALGRVAQAEATLEERREALRRTVVRAPINGYVGQRGAEVGMQVDANTHLYTIGNLDEVRVQVAIPDEVIGRIQPGQTAVIASRNLDDQTLRAEVSRISPFLESGSFSAEAEIDVSNEEGLLRPGMFVTVDILYGESQQATLVPLSALYEDPNSGVLGVFVASSIGQEVQLEEPETYSEDDPPPLTEPTPMTFREVEVLARGRELAGITGVEPGAWVVTVGQNLLSGRGERPEARVRPVAWERIASLQQLQDQDLLRQFMQKQQRMSRERFQPDDERTAEAPSDSTQAAVFRRSAITP